MGSAMARLRGRAAARQRLAGQTPELNLNSMMDLFAVLIPALLMMSAVLQISLLDVAVPSLRGADAAPPGPPPFEVTLTLLGDGYRLSTRDGVLLGADLQPTPPGKVDAGRPSLPLVRQRLQCAHYHDTRPPPRRRNAGEAPCDDPSASRDFWVYDRAGLTARIVALKEAHPEARRLIIDAVPEVEYESVIDAMDATRDVVDAKGDTRTLFDEVLLSPGL